MIDSINPRIMADNIKKLDARPVGTQVEGNPSGSGFNTLLTKLKIGNSKYKLPANVTANPADEATDSLTKIGIGSGIYSISGGSSGHTYSTTEAVVGKWIDDADVYEKTYYVAAPTKNANTLIADSLMDSIDKVISIEGTYKRSLESIVMTYKLGESEGGTDSSFIRIEMPNDTAKGILYNIKTSNTASDLIIIIRYTKVVTP